MVRGRKYHAAQSRALLKLLSDQLYDTHEILEQKINGRDVSGDTTVILHAELVRVSRKKEKK